MKDGDNGEEEPERKVFKKEDGGWKANKKGQKVKGAEEPADGGTDNLPSGCEDPQS